MALGTIFTLYATHNAFTATLVAKPFTDAVSASTLSSVQQNTIIPAGTEIPVTFTSEVTSVKSRTGDIVTAKVARDIWIGGKIAIPSGTPISGQITSTTTGPCDTGLPHLTVDFNRLSGKAASLSLVSPALKERSPASNARIMTGSILLGAILGHQGNQRRAEIGALLGGLAGAADATRVVPEIKIRSGESGMMKLAVALDIGNS